MEKIIDTNILIRLITNDNAVLAKESQKILENNLCIVPSLVLAETVYVLESVYEYSRKDLEALYTLFQYPSIQIENENIASKAFEYYFSTQFSFLDCWLIALQLIQGKEIATQDKKLKKFLDNLK